MCFECILYLEDKSEASQKKDKNENEANKKKKDTHVEYCISYRSLSCFCSSSNLRS